MLSIFLIFEFQCRDFFPFYFGFFFRFCLALTSPCLPFVFQCHKLCRRLYYKNKLTMTHTHTGRGTHTEQHIQAHTHRQPQSLCSNITHTPCGQLFWVGGCLALIFVCSMCVLRVCVCVCLSVCCCCCCCFVVCCFFRSALYYFLVF